MPESTSSRVLRPYQVEAADSVRDAWNQNKNRVSVVLPTGTGKQLAHSTPVPTPSGMKLHGDLHVGDVVFHSSGQPTRVTHVHPHGVVDVWRMTFSDKSSILAGKDHLWKVCRRKRKPTLKTTWELANSPLRDFADDGRYMWRIPMTEPVEYPNADLPIDPYMMGTLITDKGLRGRSSQTPLTVPGIKNFPQAVITTHSPDRHKAEEYLRSTGLDKFIPQQYLTAHVDARISLLKGILDGDDCSRTQGRCSLTYHTESYHLATDVQRLVWSLGGTAVLSNEYTLKILLPPHIRVPWYSVYSPTVENIGKVETPHRSIVSVEYAGKEECQCITVQHSDGLYLAGEEHIVTHNSTVIASVATKARDEGKKVLLLAHRAELLDQMAGAVQAVDPDGEEVGIVAADRDENSTDIVAASFQTLSRSPNRLAALGKRDVILADECHHISAPTYLKVLENLGAMDDTTGVTSCGFTATMYRDDGKALGDVWSEVVYEKDLIWAIDNGFLIPPKGKTIVIPGLNKLASIKTVAGDYKQNDLADVMGASVDSTVDAILRHCPNSAMIVFAVSVEHAQVLAEKLAANGIPARDVTGAHKRDYREEAYADFREGRLNCLVTVQVLTEGADFPRCDTVVLARPTRSKVLLTQIIGRSVRPYTDPLTGLAKTNAVVLDLSGVVRDVKLASLTDLFPDADTQYFDDKGTNRTDDEEFVDTLLSRPKKKEREGRLDLEDIDLLDRSRRRKVVWLRTGPLNGTLDEVAFMPLKNGGEYVFLYPPVNRLGDQMVALGHFSKQGVVSFLTGQDGQPVRGTLTQAMDAAEKMVGPQNYISDKAGWRHPSVAPSEKQVMLGRNLGIPNAESLSRGQLSDKLSEIFASRIFADVVRKYPC